MKKNVMRKNLRQSILKSITRYVAIVAIIALGAGMFVGLRSTKTDMIATGQLFMDRTNMFDLRLASTLGWGLEDVADVAVIDGIVDAEGVITIDALGRPESSREDGVYKLYAIPETINKVNLLGGRMPQSPDECLVDGAHVTEAILGTKFLISNRNKADTLDILQYREYTVVGYVSTPLYMDMSRGTTTLGNGSVSSYLYLPRDAFDVDYYTYIDVTIEGDYDIYTEEFDAAMDEMAAYVEPLLKPLAEKRLEAVRTDALDAYDEGMTQYKDGFQEYWDGYQQANQELLDAYRELESAQAEVDANRKLLEDGLKLIDDGQTTIDENRVTIITSRQQLAEAKADAYAQIADANEELMKNYKTVNENLTLVKDGLMQLDTGMMQLESGISQLENGLQQLKLTISLMDTMIEVLDLGIRTTQAALDRAKENGLLSEEAISELEAQLQEALNTKADYEAQYEELQTNLTTYSQQLDDLYAQRDELTVQRGQLMENQKLLEDALEQIDDGFMQLQNSQIQMENEFALAEAQIESGQLQLDLAQTQLDEKREEAEEGLAKLQEAQQQLDEGWAEYEQGKSDAILELNKGHLRLISADAELKDAWRTIQELTVPDVYALTRNTNVSYLSLDSNSDIVEGVSAVFPAFFLLIAALVCITTMTRMVEEERTQIGTLKALGYSNAAIIGKYLAYAGSAAIIGCGLGVIIGSVVFPMILWQAYNIILNITPNIELRMNWGLCGIVVVAYTAVSMLVTWYCCRMELREVPAELIRPKPPTTGKKILLEHLPFWNKISFLNKVMLRNIFRYRQRLLMMLVGIGGCTALLLTGFGVRDSIVNIVDFQFEDVTLYDMEARFAEGVIADDQLAFESYMGRYCDQIIFAHQSTVEMDFDGQTRDTIMISADGDLVRFMDFHRGKQNVQMPGDGEVLLSIGIAEKMGIAVGDIVTLRDPDMRVMELTVSGIYENYVYNYAVVSPLTIAENWGALPELQVAYLNVRDGQDVHVAGTKVANYENVMNVTICADLAEQVGSMLDAMNLVVITVVVCAGILAITVLYNLTNINITERIREIATIKVLGFNARESAAYVFKENLLLSAMGSLVGLLGGYALLVYVMSQIQVDMVWMPARLMPMSYVWAVVLTMLSACIVDFILYFKLDKINMAEALKSVE